MHGFRLDKAMLVQMRVDPGNRLFNDTDLPETFLRLRENIIVDYEYKINAQLKTKMPTSLYKEMYKELTKTKDENKLKTKKFFGNKY